MLTLLTLPNCYFTGPAVIVGVTMYVLSISSLSEVQMVKTIILYKGSFSLNQTFGITGSLKQFYLLRISNRLNKAIF
jgi:hypothetical protein